MRGAWRSGWVSGCSRLHPLLVSWIVANVGAVLLATLMVGLGFLVVEVLLSSGAVADADAWLPRWVEDRRSPFWTDASYVGVDDLGPPRADPAHGGGRALARPAEALEDGQLRASRRSSRRCSCYGLVTRFIERPRPEPVEQLDTFNLLHSFPSGHVAASVAIYGALGAAPRCALQGHPGASRDLDGRGGIPARRRLLADLPRRAPPHRRHRRSADGRRRVAASRSSQPARRAGSQSYDTVRACRASRGRGAGMSTVAVIAHSGKSLDGGLPALRKALERQRRRRSALVRGAEEPAGSEAALGAR